MSLPNELNTAARPPAMLPLPTHLRAPLRALHGVAAAMVAVPLFELAPRLWPLSPLAGHWRYEAYAGLAGTVLMPAGGLVISHWIAAIDDDRRLQRITAIAATTCGSLLLAAAPIFLRDYLMLRDEAATAMRGAIDSAAWRTLFAGIVAGAALLLVGIYGRRSADTPRLGQIKKKGGNGGLVVGQEPLAGRQRAPALYEQARSMTLSDDDNL